MLILSMGLIVLMDNQTRSMKLTSKASSLDQAITLASNKMSELTLTSQTKGIDALKTQEEGEFEDEFNSGYKWKYFKSNVPVPDFAKLLQTTNSSESEKNPVDTSLAGPMQIIVQTWSQSIFELRVEVLWQDGTKEKSYTLVTHLIKPNASQGIEQLLQGIQNEGS